MSGFYENAAVLRGLVLGIVGAALWLGAGQGILTIQESWHPLIALFVLVGVVLMVAGPGWYWFGRPAAEWWSDR